MFPGASVPFIAKLCAVAVVTTGAGVATYEVVSDSPAETVEVAAEHDSPATADPLAFADDASENDRADVEEKARKDALAKGGEDPEPDKDVKPAEEKRETDEKETKASEDSEKKDEADEKDEPTEPADTAAPDLVILHPADGSHHDDKHIVFEGKTEPEAVVKAGPYEATVDAEGNWRIELILDPGANRAVLSAFDAAGNVAEASVVVHLDVEEEQEKPKDGKDEKPTDEEPEQVEFSANQKWGYCEEEVPYDVFWGRATPNTEVHIVSPYGSAVVEVGKHGHWEKKVYFENAPRNEVFVVVVEAVNGRTEFEFVAEGEHAE